MRKYLRKAIKKRVKKYLYRIIVEVVIEEKAKRDKFNKGDPFYRMYGFPT